MPRDSIGRTATAALLLAVAANTLGCTDAGGSDGVANAGLRGPNVVIVVMDTTRADRCSFNGYARPTTPALEVLAQESTVFTAAYSPAPWTPPSHASLFTGVRPERHGLRGDSSMILAEDFTTLAEHLQGAGYATAAFTTNSFVQKDFGLAQGFEVFDELFKEPDLAYPSAPTVLERAFATARDAHDAGRPFFLFTNHMEPHLPYSPPADVQAGFVASDVSPHALKLMRSFAYPRLLEHNLAIDPLRPNRLALLSDLYDAEIATLDRALGHFVERLRRAGLLDDTLLVITSDHGENLGEHGLVDHMFSVHRTLLHVPLLIRYPRRFEAGRRVDDVVRLEDVFPTVLEVCGLPVPEDIDAAPLTGDLAGRIAIGRFGNPARLIEQAKKVYPQADTSGLEQTLWSVLDGRHHLIRGEYGRVELYDLDADPGETDDIAPSRPAIAEHLRQLLPQIAR